MSEGQMLLSDMNEGNFKKKTTQWSNSHILIPHLLSDGYHYKNFLRMDQELLGF